LAYRISPDQTAEVLAAATEEVLETMFFSTVFAEPEETLTRLPENSVTAQVRFRGNPSGVFTVGLALPAAQSVAENFLGLEPGSITHEQICGVVREMANMICGSVLTRIDSDTLFDLLAPEILDSAQAAPMGPTRVFDVDGNGLLQVTLRID
jgi:CheY-specific phosphatase CheX